MVSATLHRAVHTAIQQYNHVGVNDSENAEKNQKQIDTGQITATGGVPSQVGIATGPLCDWAIVDAVPPASDAIAVNALVESRGYALREPHGGPEGNPTVGTGQLWLARWLTGLLILDADHSRHLGYSTGRRSGCRRHGCCMPLWGRFGLGRVGPSLLAPPPRVDRLYVGIVIHAPEPVADHFYAAFRALGG